MHAAAHLLAETFHIGSRGVPVLIRKLQCFSETCAPPRVRPRHPAASISSHAFMSVGLRNVEPPVRARTGWRPRVLHGSPPCARQSSPAHRVRAQPDTDHDCAMRQGANCGRRMPDRPQQTPLSPLRVTISTHRGGSDLAAISAAVHHHGAADAPGDAREKFQPGKPGSRGMFCHGHVQRSGAGDDAVRFEAIVPKPRARRMTTPGNHRHARSGSSSADACTGISGGRACRNCREIRGIRGSHQCLCRPADAEPG